MGREEFAALFHSKIQEAISRSQKMASTTPAVFEIEFHGAGVPGRIVSFDEAVRRSFVGSDIFHLIIDIGVKRFEMGRWRIFVRVSDHSPGPFDKTWNNPHGSGPFKLLDT